MKMNKHIENSEATLDRILGLINNCDQKANMLLALLGLFITFFVTSDYARFLKIHLWNPIKNFFDTQDESTRLGAIIPSISLLALCVCLVVTIVYLLNTIRPRTKKENSKRTENGKTNEVREPSKLYFEDIAACKSFEDFQNMETDYDVDIQNQIWQNGRICSVKFKNFNRSLIWFVIFLIMFVIFIVSLLFV